MSSIDLQELRAVRTSLVVYVGAELSRAAGLPTRRELARLLVDALPDRGGAAARRRELAALAEAGDLTDAFTELERELTPARFGREVERALDDRGVEPPLLARVLAGLGPRVQGVLTPNLDRLLERAFASRLEAHVRPSTGLLQRADWLLKLNGTLYQRDSWVFTREQRARVGLRDPIHAKVLRALVMSKPMLLVGTPVDDPIFDEVLAHVRDLAEGAPPRHWAMLSSATLDASTRAKLDDAGIAVILHDDEREVLESLASLAPDPGRMPELPASRPRRALPRGPTRILFVASNPRDMDSLAVDHEQRVIREALVRAARREDIELEVRVAASFGDLSRALLDERGFDLVHVAGHGDLMGIVLDEGGRTIVLPPQLAALFDEYAAPKGRLRCVVLNACWSDRAAASIALVPTVVAMHGPVDDRAALAFTEGFYDAIGAGHAFAAAFREGQRRGACAVPSGPFEARLVERG